MLSVSCIYEAKASPDFIAQAGLCLCEAMQLNTEVLGVFSTAMDPQF